MVFSRFDDESWDIPLDNNSMSSRWEISAPLLGNISLFTIPEVVELLGELQKNGRIK